MTDIFVGNLTFRTTEADIYALFELYGAVQSVALMKDPRTGHSCGFAIVHMPNHREAGDAIVSLNRSLLGGYSLRVEEAKKPNSRAVLLPGSLKTRTARA